jgi:hypothetical protein
MAFKILTKISKFIDFFGMDKVGLYFLAVAAIGYGGNTAHGSAYSSQVPHYFQASFSPTNPHFQRPPMAHLPTNIPSPNSQGFFSTPNFQQSNSQPPFFAANPLSQSSPVYQPMNISSFNPQGFFSTPNFQQPNSQTPFFQANPLHQNFPVGHQPINISPPNPQGFFSTPNFQQPNSQAPNFQPQFFPANPLYQSSPTLHQQWPQNAFSRENDAEEYTMESIYKDIQLPSLEELETEFPGTKNWLGKLNSNCDLEWKLHAKCIGETPNMRDMESFLQNYVKKFFKNSTSKPNNLSIFLLEIADHTFTRPYFFRNLSVLPSPFEKSPTKTKIQYTADRFNDEKILNIFKGTSKIAPEIAKWKKEFSCDELLFFITYKRHIFLLVPLENTGQETPYLNSSHWQTPTTKKVVIAAAALSIAAGGAFLAYMLMPKPIKALSGYAAQIFKKSQPDSVSSPKNQPQKQSRWKRDKPKQSKPLPNQLKAKALKSTQATWNRIKYILRLPKKMFDFIGNLSSDQMQNVVILSSVMVPAIGAAGKAAVNLLPSHSPSSTPISDTQQTTFTPPVAKQSTKIRRNKKAHFLNRPMVGGYNPDAFFGRAP